ncbi:MAG: hypothetical protein ACP5OG_03435 [Candidatus Nanoarchaeia archaeon]
MNAEKKETIFVILSLICCILQVLGFFAIIAAFWVSSIILYAFIALTGIAAVVKPLFIEKDKFYSMNLVAAFCGLLIFIMYTSLIMSRF